MNAICKLLIFQDLENEEGNSFRQFALQVRQNALPDTEGEKAGSWM